MSAPAASETRVVVAADQLRAFAASVLEAMKAPAEDAAIMADALVWADLRGITKQGLIRLPQCVERMRAGGTRAASDGATLQDYAAFAAIDARDSWAPVAGARAMHVAIEKARRAGVGVAVVRNTTFAFAMGYYPTLAIAERMIGLAINDCLPVMAAHGSTTRAVGNQAYAIGCPAGRHVPLLLDTATSAITWTAIHELQERGEPLPAGVAVGPDGRPTADPVAALAGSVLPLGGPKGYGMAVLWEVLTGVLSGGELFGQRLRGPNEVAKPMGTSLFMLAIDPAKSMPYERFVERVDTMIDEILASPPAEGVDRVYAPGERGYATAARRQREGIPIAAQTARELHALGESLGVAWPAP